MGRINSSRELFLAGSRLESRTSCFHANILTIAMDLALEFGYCNGLHVCKRIEFRVSKQEFSIKILVETSI